MNYTTGKSLIPWIGGKRLLAKNIINQMPEHKSYVEVFAGGANVLFRKKESEVEIINDINNELINFYRVVRNHYSEFYSNLGYLLASRAEFELFKATPPETMTDIQRAVRFFYIQKNCFGGKSVNPTFGVRKVEKPRFNPETLKDTLEQGHKRLSRVLIECLSYEKLIPRYDAYETLFYLDPPYWGVEDYYGKECFSRTNFQNLKDILSSIKGKFILSINDVAEIRELFANFNIREVETNYSINTSQNQKVSELIIKNF